MPAVVDIWYEASVLAHDFVNEEYWRSNKDAMTTRYLPMAETAVAVLNGGIAGFVSMVDDYLAAVFVKPALQGRGVGGGLLDHAKRGREVIRLKVFAKNRASVEFYEARGFTVLADSVDEGTGEAEHVMEWRR